MSVRKMDPCKKREPRVIDHTMIEQCLEEQGLKGEAGRLARLEGIPWDEVINIRLEFMNILRIDHLWVLPGLKKLSLSNNLIENIENLETLANLTHLDLSFNKIKKMENLETLVNLETLTLFANFIPKIENVDSLKKLVVFSIGNNQITDRDNVLYLRRFPNLKSVNMAGNPCAKDNKFELFVAAFLPKVVYYEYKMILESDREEGINLNKSQIMYLEELESKDKEVLERLEAEEAESELHSESFVEFLGSNYLFNQMFEKDADGKTLLKMGDEAKDNYTEFEEEFTALCLQVFEIGQEQFRLRKAEVEQFLKNVKGAKLKAQQDSIDQVEVFLNKKSQIFDDIKVLQEKVDDRELTIEDYNQKIFEYADTYNGLIHDTWKMLMGLEITLFEQVVEVNETFEHTLTDMVNTFIESAQGIFAQMRSKEQTYLEVLTESGVRYMTTAGLQPDFIMPKELRPLMVEKEVLTNAIAASHDLHLQTIDSREDALLHRANIWLDHLVSNLQKDEIERNRSNILEINHYLDIQREEFDQLAAMQVGPTMDPDLTAALS